MRVYSKSLKLFFAGGLILLTWGWGLGDLGINNAQAYTMALQQTEITDRTISPKNTDLWMTLFQQLSTDIEGQKNREQAEQIPERIWEVIDVYVSENGTDGSTFITLVEMLADSYAQIGFVYNSRKILIDLLNNNSEYFDSRSLEQRVSFYRKLSGLEYDLFTYEGVENWNDRAVELAFSTENENLQLQLIIEKIDLLFGLLPKVNLLFGVVPDDEFFILLNAANKRAHQLYPANNPIFTDLKLFEARNHLQNGDILAARKSHKAALSLIRKGAVLPQNQKDYWRDRGLVELIDGHSDLADSFLDKAGVVVHHGSEIGFGSGFSFKCPPQFKDVWAVFSIKKRTPSKGKYRIGNKVTLLGTNGNKEIIEPAFRGIQVYFAQQDFEKEQVFQIGCSPNAEEPANKGFTYPDFNLASFNEIEGVGDEEIDGLITHLKGVDPDRDDFPETLTNLALLNKLLTLIDEAGLTFESGRAPYIGDDGLPITPLSYSHQAALYFLQGQYYQALGRVDKNHAAFEKALNILRSENDTDLLNMVSWEMIYIASISDENFNRLIDDFAAHFLLLEELERPLEEVLWAKVTFATDIYYSKNMDMYSTALDHVETVLDEGDQLDDRFLDIINVAKAYAQLLKNEMAEYQNAQSTERAKYIVPLTFGQNQNN